MRDVAWESGSEFHWLATTPRSVGPAGDDGAYFSSGRGALLALVRLGQAAHGWKRILLPTYCCQEIVDTLKQAPLKIAFFDDLPGGGRREKPATGPGDVLYIINFFGLGRQHEHAAFYRQGAPIIEDHTHDPWSDWCRASEADYIIVSCRKTVPIPDGGAVFSPAGLPLPQPEPGRDTMTEAACKKLQAMLLKALYLQGGLADKNVYRRLFETGEHAFTAAGTASMSEVSQAVWGSFPWREWRQQRRRNFDTLLASLRDSPAFTIMAPPAENLCPFALTLVFPDNRRREKARTWLIDNEVYPAVLWPMTLTGADSRAVDFSGRMLAIHCDGRYRQQDMEKIIAIIRSLP